MPFARPSLRCCLVPLAYCLLVSGASAQETQKIKKREFRSITMDGVRLVGDFYPPQPTEAAKAKGRNAPCVILLHGRPGGDRGGNRKDWGKFPEKLAREGYAVLAFDFRGHGESTSVEREYLIWNPPARQAIRAPTKISYKDFRTAADWYKLGNDLMEAKLYLNKLSDQADAEFNSNNIVVIGAEEGAIMGMIWTAHGLSGRAGPVIDPTGRSPMGILAGPRVRIDNKPEGEDVSCVIALSLQQPRLGNETIDNLLKASMDTLRDNAIGVLAVHGKEDGQSEKFWKRYFKVIKPDKTRDQYERTHLKAIDKTKLVGTKLLGKEELLGTEKLIFTYLAKEKVLKDQPWQRKKEQELQQSLFEVRLIGSPAARRGS